MSAKIYNFFQSNSNKCSPRHLEYGFDNTAELFSLRVKNFFAQGTKNLKSSRNFFKPKVSLDTVSEKTVLREKCTHCTKKERVCAHKWFLFFLKFSNIPFWVVSREQSMGINLLSAFLVWVHSHTRTHRHTYTHTHFKQKVNKKTRLLPQKIAESFNGICEMPKLEDRSNSLNCVMFIVIWLLFTILIGANYCDDLQLWEFHKRY